MIFQRRVIDEKFVISLLVENIHDLFSNIRVFSPKFRVDLNSPLSWSSLTLITGDVLD